MFASRSPHRPNPIGLTLAKLDAIVGNTLFLSAIDLLDGTPVLDIKPYVPHYDKPFSLHEVEDKLELKNSEWQNKDILRSQEPVSQPVPISSGSQLTEQSSVVPMKENLVLKSEPTSPSIAEWIRKPPINELEVKFSAEAVDQITCFHRKKQSLSNELHNKCDDLSVYKCTCFKTFEEVSENFAAMTTGEEPHCFNKEFKLSSNSKTSLNEKSNEALEDLKGSGFQEELSPIDKSYLVCEKVCGDMRGISQPAVDPEILQPSGVCIYQLELLTSPEEAKQAITDILKADPRSVYRRNQCQDQLYRFSLDTMNVTCKFEESTVEVLRVEPVSCRTDRHPAS